MSYLVTLTFDLENGQSIDYETINDKLDELGLYREIKGSKNVVQLPYNTYAGEFNGENKSEVRDYIAENVKSILREVSISAKFFITVGSGWAWLSSSVK